LRATRDDALAAWVASRGDGAGRRFDAGALATVTFNREAADDMRVAIDSAFEGLTLGDVVRKRLGRSRK
jgi:hypothetical protein